MSKVHKFHRMNTEEYQQELLDLAKSFRSKPVSPKDPVLGPKKQVVPPTSDYQAKVQEYLKRKGEKKSIFSGIKSFFKRSEKNLKNKQEKAILHSHDYHPSKLVDENYDEFGYPLHEKIKKNEAENFEALEKSKKDILPMFGPTPEQHHHDFANWASKSLPNKNWQVWAARNYKKNPEGFTPEVKQTLEHFGGSTHMPEVAKVRFDKTHDVSAGVNMFQEAENAYNKRISQNVNVVKPDPGTKKVVDVGGGMAWYSLGRGACSAEGKAMGHCGNVPSEETGDKILSLRTEHKNSKGEVFHEPHATFIVNNGYLGEMKGRANTKPHPKYHKDIVELLKNPNIKGIFGGGYQEENNFNFFDLSPEHQAEVLKYNPNLITDTESDQNIEKIINSKLPDKHISVRANIARNPNVHQSVHAKLANDENAGVRWNMASNPNVHQSLHAKLANDENAGVRWNMASNPNVHQSVHAKLANDEDAYVRRNMASNPNVHQSVHAKLANDEDADVRRKMASNPSYIKHKQKQKLATSEDQDGDLQKNDLMQKMSRPRITFPNFPEITNRPDQNVKTLENERQKKLYGKQVANAEFRDREVKRPTRLSGSRKPITSKDQLIDEYGKRIAGRFGRTVLGLSHNTPQGPKSAALAGKLRSKFEEGDEADKTKVDAHKIKVAEARQKYESDIKAWKEKADQLPRGSTEYWAHIGSRPKYKAPRRPAKSLKDTKELSPEKMALRGKTVDSTIEHEGFHDLMAHIENKYGPVASGKVVNDLISQHHPEAIEAVGSFVRHAMGYKRNAPRYNEELITHARDILVNPTKRERFKKFLAESMHGRALVSSTNPDREAVFKEMISHLKRGHQKAYERAKQIKLADIRPDLVEQPQKMAASEQARIQQTNTSWKFPQRPKKAPKAKFMSIEGENPQIAEPSKSGSPALNKGAARRLHGKIDPLKMPDREKIKEWQTSTGFLQELDSSYDEERHRGVREELPEMGSGTKHRALNKLSSKTLTRRHPQTGERQFLLFRGIGQDENHTVYPKHIHNTESSSWTPHLHVAKGFESDRQDDHNRARTVAAWVNESDIHAAPHMYGNIRGAKFYVPDKRLKGKNKFAFEHEIIVKPHKSMRATKADVQRYQAIHNPTRTKISTSDPKKDLNARINYRGEQQQVRPSTKEYPIIRMTKPIPSAVLEAAGMGMKKPKKMAASEMEKNESADKETQKIKENQQKPEAKKPHKFKAAEWTHPNGHPRCIICGDEERVGGMCEGLNE